MIYAERDEILQKMFQLKTETWPVDSNGPILQLITYISTNTVFVIF